MGKKNMPKLRLIPHDREEFSMEFDLFAEGTLVSRYKRLARRKIFSEPSEVIQFWDGGEDTFGPEDEVFCNELLKFVILMVDNRGNPLADYKDFSERADMAALYVDEAFEGQIRRMWESQHTWILLMVNEYLKALLHDEYALWYSLRWKYYQDCLTLVSPMPSDESSGQYLNAVEKIRAGVAAQLEAIKKIELSLFPDKQVRDIAIESTADAIGGWAEQNAEDFR